MRKHAGEVLLLFRRCNGRNAQKINQATHGKITRHAGNLYRTRSIVSGGSGLLWDGWFSAGRKAAGLPISDGQWLQPVTVRPSTSERVPAW